MGTWKDLPQDRDAMNVVLTRRSGGPVENGDSDADQSELQRSMTVADVALGIGLFAMLALRFFFC